MSSLYKKIQQRAYRLLDLYIRHGHIKAPTAPCGDCGQVGGSEYCYDHRDYSDALNVVAVCRSCNKKRGHGIARLFDVQAAAWIDIPAKHRVRGIYGT